MALRVLIVPDKFKYTLTAREVAQAIATGWKERRAEDIIETLPMSDGGDGFGEVLGELFGAHRQQCMTTDAAGRERCASWWLAPRATAIIEAAQSNGLALLPKGEYHPFELDTFGLAALLRAPLQASVSRIFVGIGGSATNDGGFGFARALGWRFLDERDQELRVWTDLIHLARVQQPSRPMLSTPDLLVAVDVSNPLLGPAGATRVYGPQKGLREAEVTHAEACLNRLAEVVHRCLGQDFAAEPGSGAAGGLGFGLRAFTMAQLCPGAELFAAEANLDHRIAQADLVITAEGCFDRQSLMGKGVGRVATSCERNRKRCLCLAGLVELLPQDIPWSDFSAFSMVPTLADRRQSHLHAAFWLRELAGRVAASV